MKVTKSMIAPIIAVLALFIKSVFNIEIPNELQDQAAVVIVGVFALVTAIRGIWKNHFKGEVK